MKNKLLVIALLITNVYAVTPEEGRSNMMTDMKIECQHIVYGTGQKNIVPRIYMSGLIRGQTFGIGTQNMSKYAISSKTMLPIFERACKEALNNNSNLDFETKFLDGVSVTIDKRYINNRKVK